MCQPEQESREDMRRIVELISRASVFLHQDRTLSLGNDEASLRVALTDGLRQCGESVSRAIASTLIYNDMDQREHERIYLVVGDEVIVDVRAIEAISEYHEGQLARFLRHQELPVGLLVNFGVKQFEPEIVEVASY
jgi:GxxExxY protein